MTELLSGIWSCVLAGVAFVGLVSFWALQLADHLIRRVFRRVKSGEITP